MLRDHHIDRFDLDDQESVWPVLSRDRAAPERVAEAVDDLPEFQSAPACPDVPSVVGGLLFGVYAALIGALALATAGSAESWFMLAIAAFFVIAFFTVPSFFFAVEPRRGERPPMDRFLEEGVMTYTGRCSGSAALVQMLIVPVSLAAGVLIIALEAAIIF